MRLLPLTFRARLTLRWTVMFGLLLAAANLAIYFGVREFLYRDLHAKLRTLGATEVASAVDRPLGVHLHEFPAEAMGQREFAEKLVQIYDQDGHIVQQSRILGSTPPLVPRSRLERVFAGRMPLLQVTALGRPAHMVVVQAERDGRRYAIAVGLFDDQLEYGLSTLAWLLSGVWMVGVGATAGIGFALGSTVLRPVERITERAASIARGDFAGRLDPPAVEDEVGRMTHALNSVLDKLHGVVQANQRFASDASHELRGPITAMAGEIDVTLKHERSAEDYRETLTLLRERLDSLVAVTEDLMVLVRAQESESQLDVREVPLVPLISAAAKRQASAAAARNITIRLDRFPALMAYGDPRLLARVFDNVIANAVAYNRDGGEVVISGGFEEPADDSWQAASAIVLVRDTGTGIPAADHERVFERFYRVDASRARHTGGTGLGLAICREVLGALDGSIRVAESSPAGTIMEIRLPGHGVSSAAETSVLVSPPTAASA